ncbi:MAG: ABC transporter ATP-binding protein [Carnobacterium sp.]|uniref:ABC transporter ATP-binding protein n=1 Tax=Carnobacterium sp. TaxID=48221 RepID=UPI002FC6E49D
MKKYKNILATYKKMSIVYLISGILISWLSAATIFYFQKIIDSSSLLVVDKKAVLFYGLTLIFVPILSYLDEYPKNYLANNLYFHYKQESLKKVSLIRYDRYVNIGFGVLLQRIENGATAGKQVVFDFYFRIVRELIPDILFNVFFILLINKKLIMYLLIGYLVVFFTTKFLYGMKESILVNEEQINRVLSRGIMELVTFRINKRYEKELAELNILINETVVSRTRIALIHELFFTLFAVLVSLIKILVVCLFIFNQLEGSIGTLVALIIYIDKIYSPIAIFNVLYVQFKMNSVSFDRLIEFLELENEDNLINGYYEVDPIEFINLENISYSIDETLILDTIFLQFEKGKRYALIGESGAGKSTLVKLIVGLIKPTKGTIRFNQRNITELNFNSLYEKVTYISQDSPIFDGSLRENIIFDKKVSDDKVIEMLKTCRLEKYFNQLEHGLDEQLGEKGVKLSGGQKQRIAFARMAFSDSDLIILDEATSALDHLTEKAVMQNILPFFENKIVIFITHKMNFLESIDQIICLKNGLVIEEGSYDELIEKQGYLYELKQNSKKE